MHNHDKCITVNLDHETYKRIVFEVDNKEAAATLNQRATPFLRISAFRIQKLFTT